MQKEFDVLISSYLRELNREAEIIAEFAKFISAATNERRRLRTEFEKIMQRERPANTGGYQRPPELPQDEQFDHLIGEVQKTFERLQFANIPSAAPPIAFNARRNFVL